MLARGLLRVALTWRQARSRPSGAVATQAYARVTRTDLLPTNENA